jgi:putative (di)nucleoside polyphosphate hydrolase
MTKLTAKGERYIGQKQLWFLLRLIAAESQICLTKGHKPEFDEWRWVDYEYPIAHIVAFKKEVYQQALTTLRAYL